VEIIESLAKISFDTLFTAFNEAFWSYEIQINKQELFKFGNHLCVDDSFPGIQGFFDKRETI
jgi:hypothetical protein